ncbi:sugar-specific transcriptional regulator trmb [Halogeometricum pallidum JCM 14848]|uniref:Sugar-specific transcriptional regulator trmb n=1 Tax=Halogeometricum pallidum JCM 14848 TaxID=1227487 RepID=M0DJQ9_HALPD|nr:sugar-specific transcriptional regulator trmb [Halogeometricum pallidum]ELZ34942.1 sugar-specific transcriptional regulator trmb [Halogeometricum pallidum JCM 14848]
MQGTVQPRPAAGADSDSDSVTVPAELKSPRAKLVYLFLSVRGESSVTELQSGLEMKKISLYSILGTLCDRGFVHQDAERYRVA